MHETVHERIVVFIAGEGLTPHARLPCETALGALLGASRPVVRQVLARLRSVGRDCARQAMHQHLQGGILRLFGE